MLRRLLPISDKDVIQNWQVPQANQWLPNDKGTSTNVCTQLCIANASCVTTFFQKLALVEMLTPQKRAVTMKWAKSFKTWREGIQKRMEREGRRRTKHLYGWVTRQLTRGEEAKSLLKRAAVRRVTGRLEVVEKFWERWDLSICQKTFDHMNAVWGIKAWAQLTDLLFGEEIWKN